MSSYLNNILPAHMAATTGHNSSEMFYPRSEKSLDSHHHSGGYHNSNSHNMCYDTETAFGNYNSCYPMYERLEGNNQIQPMNLVSKHQGFCHTGNGSLYPYQTSHNFNSSNHIQGLSAYPDERSQCVKSEDNCIPTPPPNYPHHEQHPGVVGQLSLSGPDLNTHPHLTTNPAALNGLSQQNMAVYPWMRAAVNGGNIIF